MEKARGRDTGGHDGYVDLGELAAGVMKTHAPGALRRGVRLSFEVEGEPSPVRGDAVMLSEALDNLVDNALRYGCGEDGQVEVRVEYRPDCARLVVADRGPGVAEDQRDRVFQRFHRAVEDGSDGCGLGLPIVREVAERHGGEVSLAETEEGARFELTLPRRDRQTT